MVTDILAGDGKNDNLFLQCVEEKMVRDLVFTSTEQIKNVCQFSPQTDVHILVYIDRDPLTLFYQEQRQV